MKGRKRAGGISLLLTAALALGACAGQAEEQDRTEATAVAVRAVSAQRGTLAVSNEFIGTVTPQQQVTVMPMVSGVVDAVYAEIGDEVKAGDILFHIEDDAAILQKESAELSRQSAETAAQTQLGSAQVLNNISMESNIRSIQYQIDMAKDQYNTAANGAADAEQAKQDMSRAIKGIEDSVSGLQSNYNQMSAAVARAKAYLRANEDGSGQWHYFTPWPWSDEKFQEYLAKKGVGITLSLQQMPYTESLQSGAPSVSPQTTGETAQQTESETETESTSETESESEPESTESSVEETALEEETESTRGDFFAGGETVRRGVYFAGELKDLYGKQNLEPESEYTDVEDGKRAYQTQKEISMLASMISGMGYDATDLREGRVNTALSGYSSQIASMQSQAATLKNNQASLESSISQANSSMGTAAKTIDFYEDNLKDAQVTYGISNGQAYQDTAASLAAQIAAADVGVRSADLQLAYYSPTTPISGTVVSRSVELYDVAQPGYAAYVISNQDAMNVTFLVSGQVKDSLMVGMSVKLNKDGAEYNGTILEIGETVDAQSGGLYPIKAVTDVGGDRLSSGSAVKLTVDTFRAENAILLPYDAVHFESEQAYVFVIQDGKAVRTPVVIGLMNEDTVEVTEGLTEGAKVVSTWSSLLEDGVSVRVIGEEEA